MASTMCTIVGEDPHVHSGNVTSWTHLVSDTTAASIDCTKKTAETPFPSDVSALSNLQYLVANGASFKGQLPQLNQLLQLRQLILSGNELTGPVPDLSSLDSLWLLDLADNKLQGEFDQLDLFAEDKNTINVSNNLLTGSVNGISRFANVDIAGNKFAGSFSPNVSFVDFSCDGNDISGQLDFFELQGSNSFSGNKLSGAPSFDTASALGNALDLSKNEFTGSLPSPWETTLEKLDLSNNSFAGSIPKLTNTAGKSMELSMGSNNFTSSLDNLINNGNFTFLEISNNKLSGTIPTTIGRNEMLTSLDLRNNSLTGTIPRELSECTKLTSLFLGGNKLDLYDLHDDLYDLELTETDVPPLRKGYIHEDVGIVLLLILIFGSAFALCTCGYFLYYFFVKQPEQLRKLNSVALNPLSTPVGQDTVAVGVNVQEADVLVLNNPISVQDDEIPGLTIVVDDDDDEDTPQSRPKGKLLRKSK